MPEIVATATGLNDKPPKLGKLLPVKNCFENVGDVVFYFPQVQFGFAFLAVHEVHGNLGHPETLRVRLFDRFNLDVVGLAVQITDRFCEEPC